MRQPFFDSDAAPRAVRLTIPSGPDAPARARHAVRALCTACSCTAAELVVSELVTNAVRHSPTQPGEAIELETTLEDDLLRIAVTDRGEGFTHDGSPPLASQRVGGWGLHMVREISRRWWVEHVAGGGTRVVAELPVESAFAAAGSGAAA
jgi:anti-sigma regulatory factor (Ser/Thr protein kinase)